MKKENKRLAQEKRAKEREKAAQKANLKRTLQLWVPIVGAIAILVIVIAAIATSGNSTSETTDDTVPGTETADSDIGELSVEDISDSGNLNTTEGVVVQDGDTVNIDFTGYIDGETFEGGSTNGAGTDLVIGSGGYIAGFEDGIIGHSVGETFDLNLTFPEDYWNEDYAGKDVVFTTTVNGIYE